MNIAEMICQTTQILTDIRKVYSLYHYCNDRKLIYNQIVNEICLLKREDIMLYFVCEDFSEESSLEVLKIELLKLYKFLSNEFVHKIHSFNEIVEVTN
ncbi:MAG: hypothetical protein K2I42_07165 [Anaeroplasmataceae bacterium]|nr:hypothetical protein [Anaeroplasmataceae bacterium]